MRAVQKWLRLFLGFVQAIAFLSLFVLDYFGSHTMGAHRHLKVRGDQYLNGILSSGNLKIAAVIVAIVLLLLLLFLLVRIKQHGAQPKLLWSVVPGLLFSALLILILVLPAIRALLIFPWLLFCAGIIWFLQLMKMLLIRALCSSATKAIAGKNAASPGTVS